MSSASGCSAPVIHARNIDKVVPGTCSNPGASQSHFGMTSGPPLKNGQRDSGHAYRLATALPLHSPSEFSSFKRFAAPVPLHAAHLKAAYVHFASGFAGLSSHPLLPVLHKRALICVAI